MTIAIALGAAALWGVGDFCGGLATRRSSLLTVLLVSHLVGLIGLAVVALLAGGSASLADLATGAVAGLAGGAGVALLYRGLAVGPMAIVAPITGVTAASVPAIAGFAFGERPSTLALVGIVVAIAAVALLGGGPARGTRIRGIGLIFAIGSGVGFAAFYIVLSRAGGGAGLWPLVAARCATVTAFGLGVGISRRLPRADRPGIALIVGCGALDVAANALYVVAVHRGLLSIVAVLVSLYPAATVLCAMLALGERLRPAQRLGVVLALAAVALVAAG